MGFLLVVGEVVVVLGVLLLLLVFVRLLLLLSRFLLRARVTYFCLNVEEVCVVVDLAVSLSSSLSPSVSSTVISTGFWGFRFRWIVVYFRFVELLEPNRLLELLFEDDVVGVNRLLVFSDELDVYFVFDLFACKYLRLR